jgi:putative flippase GtrA
VLWLLVEKAGMAKIPAAAISFLVSNTLHYAFGRGWIYRGTERRLVPGYVYFLMNAGVGLAATVGLFAWFVDLGLQYLVARVVASIFVGLLLFVLNAVWNFRAV